MILASVDWSLVLQLTISGLAIGMGYALIGLGLSLVFGVLNLINFAHGEFYMLGAFMAYTFANVLGVPYVASVPLAALVVFVFGFLTSVLYVERLVKTNQNAMLIGTLGLSYVLLNSAQLIWGNDPQQIDVPWANNAVSLPGGSAIAVQYLVTSGVALAATVGLVVLVFRTRYGSYMRAVAENRLGAQLSGIRVGMVYRSTFALGGAIAALAGTTAGALASVDVNSGQLVVLKGFVVVIVGSLGSITGAIVAGLLLGLVETLGGGLISPQYQDGFGYLLLVVVLVVRPSGIMRRKPA